MGATDYAWGTPSALVTNAWATLVPNSYTDYCLGENFTIVADEEYPVITTEDRPLTVPPDSGVSQP